MVGSDDSDLIGYTDACKMLGVPRGTLFSLVCRKMIPHIRLGPRTVRFSKQVLTSWVASKHVAVVTLACDETKG